MDTWILKSESTHENNPNRHRTDRADRVRNEKLLFGLSGQGGADRNGYRYE